MSEGALATINLLGKDFDIHWASDGNRHFANRENKVCYELVSFRCTANHDSEVLQSELPKRIEKCWLVNPDYQRDECSELREWHDYGYEGDKLPPIAETPRRLYVPPQACHCRTGARRRLSLAFNPHYTIPIVSIHGTQRLSVLDQGAPAVDAAEQNWLEVRARIAIEDIGTSKPPSWIHILEVLGPNDGVPATIEAFEEVQRQWVEHVVDGFRFFQIAKELFRDANGEPLPFPVAGQLAYLATFSKGKQCYFEMIRSITPIPSAARMEWKQDEHLKRLEAMVARSAATQTELAQARAERDTAQETASLTVEEALGKWMRFEPPGMAAVTKARIEKAVKLYMTDPEKRSLSKIAKEFQVSRKTVSTWFKMFTMETGLPVIAYKRHESVKAHLQAEREQIRTEDAADEDCDGENPG
jgi:tartrate dehydratase beta subunit/fumarate hydratase class I family protein